MAYGTENCCPRRSSFRLKIVIALVYYFNLVSGVDRNEVSRRHAEEICGVNNYTSFSLETHSHLKYCCKCPKTLLQIGECKFQQPKTIKCVTLDELCRKEQDCVEASSTHFCDKFMNAEYNAIPCSRPASKSDHTGRCICKDGFFTTTTVKHGCFPLGNCSSGFQPSFTGNRTSNTKCEPCPSGTHSNVSSRTEMCKSLSLHEPTTTSAVVEKEMSTASSTTPLPVTDETSHIKTETTTMIIGDSTADCQEFQDQQQLIVNLAWAVLVLVVMVILILFLGIFLYWKGYKIQSPRDSQNKSKCEDLTLLKEKDKKQNISFEEIFKSKGYDISFNPEKDGNCQFAAIGKCISNTSEIRKNIVHHMGEHEDKFKPHCLRNNWNTYIEEMSQNGAFGDESTLQAACNYYDCYFVVIQTSTSNSPIEMKPDKQDHPANPLWNFLGHIDEHHGKHYVCLKKCDQSPPTSNGEGSDVTRTLTQTYKNELYDPLAPNGAELRLLPNPVNG